MRRRAWAIWSVVRSLLWLGLFSRQRTSMELDRRPEWRSLWVLLGLGLSLGVNRLIDRDVGGIRTTRWRRIGLTTASALLGSFAFRAHEPEQYECTAGWTIGTACYRLRYGVLGPPYGSDE